jgi:hypothetical protein
MGGFANNQVVGQIVVDSSHASIPILGELNLIQNDEFCRAAQTKSGNRPP